MSKTASIQCVAEGLVWEFTVASFYWKKKNRSFNRCTTQNYFPLGKAYDDGTKEGDLTKS